MLTGRWTSTADAEVRMTRADTAAGIPSLRTDDGYGGRGTMFVRDVDIAIQRRSAAGPNKRRTDHLGLRTRLAEGRLRAGKRPGLLRRLGRHSRRAYGPGPGIGRRPGGGLGGTKPQWTGPG
jgi:hypothetical protein